MSDRPDPLKYIRGGAASWWRRTIMHALGLLGGASAVGACDLRDLGYTPFAQYEHETNASTMASAEESDDEEPTIERRTEWDLTGSESTTLFPGSTDTDVDGTSKWRTRAAAMATRLTPTDRALRPYYVPTLFQSMSSNVASDLQRAMTPIFTREMEQAFARGGAVREVFGQAGWPRDTAIIIDAPGPLAVAFSAALSGYFAPVFTFDNWPHFSGVVPSHLTLAATLYYLPLFERAQLKRPTGAPPMFVLDANRLRPYTDEASQFDNRYIAKIPDAAAFRRLGIEHILYVTEDGVRKTETDDLNSTFLALDELGIDIKMVALTDFTRSWAPTPRTFANSPDECLADGTCYLYGGDVETQERFWYYFDWYWRGGEYAWLPPDRCSAGYRYRPHHRPTMLHFDGQKVIASTGGAFHPNPARSGSLGRFHGSFVS